MLTSIPILLAFSYTGGGSDTRLLQDYGLRGPETPGEVCMPLREEMIPVKASRRLVKLSPPENHLERANHATATDEGIFDAEIERYLGMKLWKEIEQAEVRTFSRSAAVRYSILTRPSRAPICCSPSVASASATTTWCALRWSRPESPWISGR